MMLSENKHVFFLWSVEVNLIITGGAKKVCNNPTECNRRIKQQKEKQEKKHTFLLVYRKIICTYNISLMCITKAEGAVRSDVGLAQSLTNIMRIYADLC